MSGLSPSAIRRLGLATAALLAVVAGLLTYDGSALSRLEGETVDARFHIRGGSTPADVAVVAVDEKTFSDLRLQWPFRRALHAALIDRLHAAGAKAIVYDVQFTEPTDPADDLALYHAAGRAGHVVFSTTEVDSHGETAVLGGRENLRRVGALAAASNLPTEAGGVIRRYPYSLLGLPSIATAAARFAGHPAAPASFDNDSALIDFRGPDGAIPTYSFSDVLHGSVPARWLRGRVIVVGATTPTLQDLHPTSTSGAQAMAGPEIQANAIWTAMHGNPLRAAPGWLAILTIVLGGLITPALALGARLVAPLAGALLAAALYLLVAQLTFDRGQVLVVVYPLLALTVGAFATTAASYAAAFAERNRFSRRLHESQIELIQRLAQAVEHRDVETGAHIRRIGLFCEQLALAAGWARRDAVMLRHASAMHDVGKIGIPDTVLRKPGPLDEQEWAIVRAHTTMGGEILAHSANPLVQLAETIARCHHERWDGSGYPAKLRGEEIPEAARICAICDAFDALLSTRTYKASWSLEQTLAEIERSAGSHFDPRLVEAFLPLAPSLLAQGESQSEPIPGFAGALPAPA